MNALKKRFNRAVKSGDQEDGPMSQEKRLCLQHLRKLFLEYLHPREYCSQEGQEQKLYQMLPLFLKVFSQTEAGQMSERFGDVLQFAGHSSKLLVNEIQRRAVNKTKARSVVEILQFLVCKPNEQENNGWNLISTLSILSVGEVAIIECMVAAALPSTLIKTIRLFFSMKNKSFTEESLRALRSKIVPTLTRLCQHSITIKELIRTDDLATLFDALTCSCDSQHVIWRVGISEILTAVTRHCLTKDVIEYIEDKNCVSLSIYNIKAICIRDPLAVVEMLVTLICVLRDSAEVSSLLLESFKACGGYSFLSNLLVDFYNSDDPAVYEASRNLVILISSLALTGHEALAPPSSMESPFQVAGFTIPHSTAGSGLTIRNLDAFKVLQETFLQTRDENLCLHILHAIRNIFSSDSSNFFALGNLHTLTLFIERAPSKKRDVQMEIFKLVEFVALHLHWVPTQELMAIGILFKHQHLKQCQTVALHTLIRLINQNERYKDVFREVGLLEVLTISLREFSDTMKEKYGASCEDQVLLETETNDEVLTDFVFLLMECLRLLIENNSSNATLFRQCSGAQCAHNLIQFRSARPYALKIVQQLIVDGGHEDLGILLGLMHTTRKTAVKLKTDVLNSMLRIFAMNGQTRTTFQEVSGFVYVVAVLVSLEGSLSDPTTASWANVDRGSLLELIWAIFQVLTAAMQDEPINKVIFMDEVRFKGLTDTMKLLGCFTKIRSCLPPVNAANYIPVSCLSHLALPKWPKTSQDHVKMTVFKCLTSMAYSSFENWDLEGETEVNLRASMSMKIPRVVHTGAISAVIELLPSLWEDEDDNEDKKSEIMPRKELPVVLINVISQLQHILGSEQNQQMLCEAGLPLQLLFRCKEAFMDDDHPLNAAMTKLFERLTSQSVAPDVFRNFLRLGSPLCCSSPYAMLRSKSKKISEDLNETDNIELNISLNESLNLDELSKQRAMSLQILDGNIEISCRSGRASPVFVEENEIDSYLDENSDENILSSEEVRSKRMDSCSISSGTELDGRESESIDSSGDSKSLASQDEALSVSEFSRESRDGENEGPQENMAEIASDNENVNEKQTCSKQNDENELNEDKSPNLQFNAQETSSDKLKDERTQNCIDGKRIDSLLEVNHGELSEPINTPEAVNDMYNEDVNAMNTNTNQKMRKSRSGTSLKSNQTETHTNGQMITRLDSQDLFSENEAETEDDLLQKYYDYEIERNCERLEGEPPSQNIIKCLVSLTTPRDLLTVTACEEPAFVEFDMSCDGFGCLFIGSLAPVGSSVIVGGSNLIPSELSSFPSSSPVGTLGTMDRNFPPPIGLTFAAWIFIERLPSSPSAKALRIFSVHRGWSSTNPRKKFAAKIFSIYLDLQMKEIVVSTGEDAEPGSKSTSRKAATELRAKQDELFNEGSWNHLCVVLNKSVVRKSTASIYVNGACVVSTTKFRYIDSRAPSGIDFASSRILGIFGTHSTNCHISELVWRLGPSCLFEDPVTDESVLVMYKLGPSYNGCYQAPVVSEYYEESSNEEILPALVTEDKITFVLNARNLSLVTLAKLKSQYSSQEAKAISEETCIDEDDRFTPVSIIYNSSLYYQGPMRTIGAVLVGTTGVRTFCPNDVASAVMSVGGMSILLSLVAMATNLEELYASLKALTCIVQSSKFARREMVRIKGYQLLGYLLKRKTRLLNTHILHLVFSLVGTVRSDQELGSIPNVIAFNDLLCDFEIWHNVPNQLEKSLFSHFYELLTQGTEYKKNAECLRLLECLPKLLYLLQDGTLLDSTLQTIANVMHILLSKSQRHSDLLRFGQFLASTIPAFSTDENKVNIDDILFVKPPDVSWKFSATGPDIIKMRNTLLDTLINLLHGSDVEAIDLSFCELLSEVLGFDWLLLFLYGHVHRTTVVRGLRILSIMLSNANLMNSFKNATSNGGWLRGTTIITNRRTKFAAGFAVPESEEKSQGYEVNNAASNVKGFSMLMDLFEMQTNLFDIYYHLFALLLGYPITELPTGLDVTLENLYLVFWSSENRVISWGIRCPDAALVLLHMLRKIMNDPNVDNSSGSSSIPAAVIQFLEFLYSNIKEFTAFCTDRKFLQYLSATLYPPEPKDEDLEDDAREEIMSETFSITNHRCRMRVIGFLKLILMDGMILTAAKSSNLLDVVLEAFPVSANAESLKEYQSSVMLAVINDVLDGSLLQAGSTKHNLLSKYSSNINTFASKLVDKLWIGTFSKDYEALFGFLLRLVEKYEAARVNPDSLYRTMNRAILYHLSRPQVRITDETSLLEFLHLLTSNSKIIFSPNNHDDDFVSCLTHWLLVIGLGKHQSETESDTVSMTSEDKRSFSDVNVDETAEEASNRDGVEFRYLSSSAAERVWDVFYQSKKEDIEDIFRMQSLTPSFTSYENLTSGNVRSMTLDLESARSMFREQALRTWLIFISAEEKKKNDAWTISLQQQQQQQVSRNPVARISMKFKKEKDADEKYTVKESLEWSFRHLSIVKALILYNFQRYQQENLLNCQSAEKNWFLIERELIRERAIWGDERSNPLDKWKLESTEGPCRMRKLLCKHEQFYTFYPYRGGEHREQISKYRTPYSHDSKLLYDVCQKYISDDSEMIPTRERTDSFTWSPNLHTMEGDTLNVEVNNQTIVQLLETGEKIYSMYRCARLRGLDSAEGLFLFGRGHFYVIDGFTLLSTEGNKGIGGDIRDIDSLPDGTHEPLIPVAKGNSNMERSFSKWSFEDIKEVHKRRYLQQNIAMEIFSNDGNNHLLVFPKKATRDKVHARLLRMSPTLLRTAADSVAGMRVDADVESGYGFFGGLIGEKHVTQRWERGEITNFQYLMYLNTLAGRSYNDLMQYPIFPWIIADYDSEVLDLTNEKTFRVLSLPMGAQTENRLRQFQERYRNWEDPLNKTPAYYYGTHYSSAMIVASYLIRLEPFTEQFLRLQGGHFDLPDRLFHGIKESWFSASEHSMADVKELIPEFFYLPEFLENQSKFDLGRKQNGDMLGDVVLPPWAKGDAREFIRLHREALECDYVSAHLHEWIDLIFGYKQKGDASIEAHNVFYHMFYEGAVDLSDIKDPVEKKSTIAVINNFGQMPRQLFKKPHACKKTLKLHDLTTQTGTLSSQQTSLSNDRIFYNNLTSLVPSVQPVKELRSAVGQIVPTEKSLFAVETNKILLAPHYNRYISWGHRDFSLKYCSSDDKVLNVFEEVSTGRILCAASLDHGSFVTGAANTTVSIWKIEKYRERSHRLRLTKILFGHQASVTSIATSLTYNIIVSGSEDKTAIVWDVRKLSYIRQLPEHHGPVSCIAVNNLTGDIVTCSLTWLYVWSINGEPLVHQNTSSVLPGQILSCALSELNEWNRNNVIITGTANGIVKMWSIDFYDAAQKEESKLPSRRKSDICADSKAKSNVDAIDSLSSATASMQNPSEIPKSTQSKNVVHDEVKNEKTIDQVSPTSSVKTEESFVFVEHSDDKEIPVKIKDWKRRLVLRGRRLTMHTSFDRRDNMEPASITALAVSKDHRKVFVGDGRGRIYSWSVSDTVGAIADHWVKDEGAERCSNCDVKFTLAERRHHCRKCGKIFCGKCSQDKHPVAQLSIFKPVRVCSNCFAELQGRHKSAENQKSDTGTKAIPALLIR